MGRRASSAARSASLLFEATAEPLLHPTGEAALVGLTAFGRTGLLPLRADGCDSHHRSGEHHQESDDAEYREIVGDPERPDGDAQQEQYQPEREDGDALEAPTAGRFAQPATADGGYELGVLGVESTLDLIEQSLLVLGEGHGFASGTTRSCRSLPWCRSDATSARVDVHPKDTSPS